MAGDDFEARQEVRVLRGEYEAEGEVYFAQQTALRDLLNDFVSAVLAPRQPITHIFSCSPYPQLHRPDDVPAFAATWWKTFGPSATAS